MPHGLRRVGVGSSSQGYPVLRLLWNLLLHLVTVEESPTSFSPFSLVDCMLISYFSFNDFIAVAFLDLARDLDTPI